MMGYRRPNNRGVAVGRVTGYSAGKVKLAREHRHIRG